MDRILAAIIGVVGLIGFAIWSSAAARYAQFPGQAFPTVALRTSLAAYPRDFLRTARARVAEDPLDQKRFNALYTYQASLAPSPSKVPGAAYQQLLAKLGWRDTAAQMNLLHAAAVREDYGMLLQRSDGLLRRGIATAQIFDVLYLLESEREWREKIAKRLVDHPQWRYQFFVNDHGYGTPSSVMARTQTIARLRSTSAPATPDEVAPMIASLVDGGEDARAYRIWLNVVGARVPRTGLLLDADLRDAASQTPVDPSEEGSATRRSPFAWRLNSGLGFDAIAEAHGQAALLRLRWDGTGVPTLASQRFQARSLPLVLRVTGSDAQPQLLSRLNFTAECKGQTITFDRLIPTQDEVLTIAADGVPACEFPEFRVSARVGGDEMRGFEIALSSLQIFTR